MPIKPIPLAAYNPDLIPPVTGINGNFAPVANSFDASGNFATRPRLGSVSKKRRLGEMDEIFDLSNPYPPLNFPGKPPLDLNEVKTLLVTAAAVGKEARPLLESNDLDPKVKAFGALSIALLQVVSAIVENGLMPLAGSGTATAGRNAGDLFAKPRDPPPPPPKTVAPGLRELRESLDKAERESILFDADLGNHAMGNRAGLNAAFSDGIRKLAIKNATEQGKDPAEAVRAMNDALKCVSDLDFIGIRSEPIKIREHGNQPVKDCHTMPIKIRFEDKNTRLHFERTIKANCGLRATMSLPKPLREEQAVFAKKIRERYPGEIVTARPDPDSLRLVAFHKKHGEGKWLKCEESVPIPYGILLAGYNVRKDFALPEPTRAIAVEMEHPKDGGPSQQPDSQPETAQTS
jgi:hypothetical protein